MCDCSDEEASIQKSDLSSQTTNDKPDLRRPCTILQVELSKNALNLLSSSESSSTITCEAVDLQENVARKSVTSSDEEKEKEYVNEDEDEEEEKKEKESFVCESKSSIQSGKQQKQLERTLAIVKPEAMIFRKEIEHVILDEGFNICQMRWLRLTPEQVSDFYLDNYKEKDFAHLVVYMSSGPILVLVIAKANAIEDWKLLIGPEKVTDARLYAPDSIRGRYGRKGDGMKNAVHGSKDHEEAEREIHFFFSDHIVEPLLKEEAAVEYFWKEINRVLSDGLTKCCEVKPEDPVIWLGNWLLDNNKKKPKCL